MTVRTLIAKSAARRAWSPSLARALRKEARVSLADAAAAIGVTTSAVSRWESGEREPRADAGARYLAMLRRVVEASRAS